MTEDLKAALAPTTFIDSTSETVRAFAAAHAGTGDDRARAVRLYRAVRDGIRYDPYQFSVDPGRFTASYCLGAPASFCVPKAIALAAAARAIGIPARLGFADVKNHLSSPRLSELMGTDVFRWHGYTLLHLEGRWVKATPAFNLTLCEKVGVAPLEFDGREDSIFHPFDRSGRRHMEYVSEIGTFDDMPFARFAADMRVTYPHLLAAVAEQEAARADPAGQRFEDEARGRGGGA